MRTTPEMNLERRPYARRSVPTRLWVGGAALLAFLVPATASAQSDVTPPLPNVLILLDTSGSMERMPNATFPAIAEGALAPKDSTGSVAEAYKNRWTLALEVLGGRIKNLDVLHTKRSTTDFSTEFSLGGLPPYDLNYYVPHFRLLTNGCAFGPKTDKTWPNDWKTWGPESFSFRKWGGSGLGPLGTDCDQTYLETDGLGLLDTYRDQARFAFMGFDPLVDPQTGMLNGSHDPKAGMQGTWSYFPGWTAGTAGAYKGWPANCTVDPNNLSQHIHELGARNPSAPPWELPLIPFASEDSTTALRNVNDRIRYAMLAARPYGATPLAPMMADAQHYMWDDPQGPTLDPSQTCRGNFIVLITDGFPNSDLRTSCEDPTSPKTPTTQVHTEPGGCTDYSKGCCPTKRIQDIAYDLAHPTDVKKPMIETFVVGFAVSDELGNPVDCKFPDPVATCANPALEPKFKPCCTLHETAFSGTPGTAGKTAIFADNVAELRTALQSAMAKATMKTTTSRTIPVFTQAASASAGQYEFQTAFKVNAFGPWTGTLNRIRWECAQSGPLVSSAKPFLPAEGDDFTNNLNKQATRNYFTLDAVTSTARSGDSLRPGLSASDGDGLPLRTATSVKASGNAFVSSVPATALEITSTSCKDAATIDECKQKLLNYALALPQPKAAWMDRFAMGATMGDIYHATPVNVGPPSNFLRDESYVAFRNARATRIPMLLVATNDGILHSFRTDVKSESDPSELWAFIPPAVLPHIGKQYGGAHALLLDAAPVVKDVPFGMTTGTSWGRTRDNARAGIANWRTVAVGGLTAGRGYYALDVTDPTDPKFLWQLTKTIDASGADKELFGTFPATPAIGTVFYKDPSKSEPIETPVAFLPGGEGTLFKTDSLCGRWKSYQGTTTATTPRNAVRCWIGAGNSFTVVRLQDGKILRRFSNDPAGNGSADHPAESNSPVKIFVDSGNSQIVNSGAAELKGFAGIDSPLTGTVALYPAAAGTVTTRAFVGDSDGSLWKIDVSDPDPQKWKIDLFHDPYFPGDIDNVNYKAWGPVATAPVLSVDAFSDVVVNYATGDQSNFATTAINHVYSVTERTKTISTGLTQESQVNWHIKLTGGITPTGPLSLFDTTLYFSTFKPDTASSDACLNGEGTVWGVDYLLNDAKPGPDGTALPKARHKIAGSAFGATKSAQPCPAGVTNLEGTEFYRCINLGEKTIVFGAGVTQRPSCVGTPGSGIGMDPYMGGTSSHQTVTDVSVGAFELVAQTGPGKTTVPSSGTTSTGVNTISIPLTAPLSATRIDAWAAIVE